MKITFLGTGAADWLNFDAESKNTFFRRNASALVDEVLLIDPGPCVIDAITEYSIDIKKIKYVLNTHRHRDHFNEETLQFLKKNGAQFIEVENECEFQLGTYNVQAVRGHHRISTMHYLISDGKSRLFYGLDGAWLLYDEFQAIKKAYVDFAVLDGTVGFMEGDYRIFEHNNLNMVIEMKKTLSKYVKRFCISHMARTLHTDHKTLENHMAEFGIEVAFDGMEVNF
ncbi:MAG: MBL fold metallo-hydrolase [Clostridia bacterium]|nr:MBL fold metallo-hydrolase [Clostridia bacterium]